MAVNNSLFIIWFGKTADKNFCIYLGRLVSFMITNVFKRARRVGRLHLNKFFKYSFKITCHFPFSKLFANGEGRSFMIMIINTLFEVGKFT